MTASVVINIIIFAGIVGAILWALPKAEKKRIVFRYFTVLSNLLCAVASAAVVIAWLSGAGSANGQVMTLPGWVVVLKYVGTCAVTVTLLTVLLFLAPSMGSFSELLKAQDFLLHLLCPVLAIISFCFLENTTMRFPAVFLGTAPVILYGILYLYKVIFAPEEKRWEDFYTFNRGGKWPISFVAMVAAAFVISLVLWAV